MNKLITIIFTFLVGIFVAFPAHAAVSVQVEQPKTPNNNDNFNLTFVALDTNNNPVTVKCFKGTPSTGTQFGSNITLSNGGNTANCQVNNSVVPSDGTYSFYVEADNGSETVTSNTVSVEVKRSGPGTPVDYSKDKTLSCEYKIHFKTADDGGKTVKVEVYRAEIKSFNADAATRVGTLALGSNVEHNFIQTVPDCNKTYYYVVRAFDNAGNGSGVVGDSETVVTTNTVSLTSSPSTNQGAIPVSNDSGSVLGAEITAAPTPSTGSGQTNDTDKGVEGAVANSSWFTPAKTTGIAVIVIAIILAYWYLRNRVRK